MSEILNTFVVGELYSNAEIFTSFGVANAGGLRFRMADGNITGAVLMTSVPSARKAKENPYHDRIENGILTYTAAGREGDQTLAGMVKAEEDVLSFRPLKDERLGFEPLCVGSEHGAG